jgi:hypothetical protein
MGDKVLLVRQVVWDHQEQLVQWGKKEQRVIEDLVVQLEIRD